MKMLQRISLVLLAAIILVFGSCGEKKESHDVKGSWSISDTTRIVSLNGAITEVLCKAGFEKNIVGVDLTSTWPASMQSVPKVGFTRQLQAEGILSQKPHIVFGIEKEIKPELIEQLRSAGVNVQMIAKDYTLDGTMAFNNSFCTNLGKKDVAVGINSEINQSLQQVKAFTEKPKVLFLYARGTNTLMVAGDDSPIKSFIELSGAQNAVGGFTEYKPLSPEMLVSANPDVILMFDTGLQSLEGDSALWQLPGMENTNAGKNKKVITMNGEYISCFGPRLGEAASEFNVKLHEAL